ncbi:18S rRNA biogenesis protein RCL1 [Saccharomyces cerevisiae]|nr:18S rRNA biogenesis protein RCL1 [Saccharomyces cerevisiae]
MSSSAPKYTTFQGSQNFRLRIVLATLSGKPIKIEKIRSGDLNPGLKDYEVSFLRLIESLVVHRLISALFQTGRLFVEPMLYLAPFSKKKFSILFKGITASHNDAGIEAIKWGLMPVMEKFGVRECALHTLKRGSPPLGGGEVHLVVDSLIAQPITMHEIDRPIISSITGVAYSTRVSPSLVNRMIDGAKKVLKNLQCEVNITADVWRGENSGKSPGWGITLVAQSKQKGWSYFAEDIGDAGSIPEELGEKVACQLLEEISKSAAVGRNQLPLAIVYMVIGKEDIGRLRINKEQIDERFIILLRDIKKIFNTEVFLKPVDEADNEDMIATIKGIGFTNTSKKIA